MALLGERERERAIANPALRSCRVLANRRPLASPRKAALLGNKGGASGHCVEWAEAVLGFQDWVLKVLSRLGLESPFKTGLG